MEYVDKNLMCAVDHESHTLTSAAILGLEGGVWAQNDKFPAVTQEQILGMVAVLGGNNPGSFMIGDIKFMVLGSDDPETKLRGKCTGGGCSVSKTSLGLVVGIWNEPVTAGQCNQVVETLAQYLIDNNY
eukprot:gene7457-598_t